MASKLSMSHRMNFSKSRILLVNKFTPNNILSAFFAIPCAICTKIGVIYLGFDFQTFCHLWSDEGIHHS
jgi:hypothetical protein